MVFFILKNQQLIQWNAITSAETRGGTTGRATPTSHASSAQAQQVYDQLTAAQSTLTRVTELDAELQALQQLPNGSREKRIKAEQIALVFAREILRVPR